MPDLTNAQILTAINKIRLENNKQSTGGGGCDITKRDVMDTIFLLMYFKNNGVLRQQNIIPGGSPSPISEKLFKMITNVLSKIGPSIKIDGSTTITESPIKDHVDAKRNLARIVYFLALDECDSLTRNTASKTEYGSISDNPGRYIRIQHKNNTTSTVSYTSETSLFRTYFLLASTLADNKINDGNIKPVMYFFENNDAPEGIVKIDNTLITTREAQEAFIEKVKNPAVATAEHITQSANPEIKFNTSTPKIHNVTEVTVNLRVIQTVLLGINVHIYDEHALNVTRLDTDTVSKLANDILTWFSIDIAIQSS